MRISEAFEKYRQDYIVFTNQSSRTEESHITCMKAMIVFFDDVQIESLNFQMIRKWKEELGKHCAQNTVRGYIIRLRVVLVHLYKLGIPVLNPDLIPVPKRQQTVPTYLSRQEVRLLIQHAVRLRSKAIISLLYASGIRLSELISLNRGQIHDGCFTVVGKGGKPRLCFVDKRTMKLIDKYLATRDDHHAALFLSTKSECRMTATNIQFIMKCAAKRAGITKKVTPHTLRHSFATDLLLNNTNLRYVQEMLGHNSIQTTQMYTHVVNRDLQQVYAQKHKT